MFWGLLWGVGNFDPLLTSSHSRSVPNWPAEPERTGAVGTPSPPVSAAAQSPGHRRDALPLSAFSHSLLFSRSSFLLQYFVISSLMARKKQLRVPRLLPINMRVLFPNLSPPPFLPQPPLQPLATLFFFPMEPTFG